MAQRADLQVAYCSTCDHAHLVNPRIEADYYAKDRFYQEFSPNDWFIKEYLEHKRGYWNTRYAFETSFLQIYYNLLDVGCGTGYFLDYWRHCRGGLGTGIEPSDSARSWNSAQAYVYKNRAEAKARLDPPMHLRLSLVLEHVPEPEQFLASYLELLGSKARVIISVPNEFNPLQRCLRKRYGDWFVQAPHLNYFSKESLARMAQRLSLVPVYEGATFPMELFALAGFPYITNDKIGRRCHNFRLHLEKRLGPGIYKVYGLLYRKLGWGRDTLCVYRKAGSKCAS